MALYINPQSVVVNQSTVYNTSPFVAIVETGGTLNTTPLVYSFTDPGTNTTFTKQPATCGNSVQINSIAVDGYSVNLYFVCNEDAVGNFPVTVTDPTSGDTGVFIISVVPVQPNFNYSGTVTTPTGYTAATLAAMVQLRANEPASQANQAGTAASYTNIITLANAGIEQVEAELGGIRLVQTYYTTEGQLVANLSPDTQDIISCSWSTGPVTSAGALVYPMFQFPEGSFMDFAAGFPAVGFGPPTAYFIFQDQGGTIQLQMYPAAMLGQLNVYYRARPILWNASVPKSTTNLDSMFQEAVVLWTVARVLEGRGRGGEAQQIWEPQIARKMEELRTRISRRSSPKSGRVRDVTNRGYPSGPWGWL